MNGGIVGGCLVVACSFVVVGKRRDLSVATGPGGRQEGGGTIGIINIVDSGGGGGGGMTREFGRLFAFLGRTRRDATASFAGQ